MRIIETLKEMTETARGWLVGGTVGFVLVKGELHTGHISLIQEAQKMCEIGVVGLLGCCLPFTTDEERALYLLTLDQKLHLLNGYQNLVVFIPQFEEIYPAEFKTHVVLAGPPIEQLNENEREYVRAFLTLTVKLLHLVQPDVVYSSQKDALQIAILHQVIRDLNIDVHLRIVPSVRESDGLVINSRNSKLTEAERHAAAFLYPALLAGKELIMQGERRSASIEWEMTRVLQGHPLILLEGVGVYASETFLPVAVAVPGSILSVTVHIGAVRLSDTITWMENGQWRM